MKTKTTISSALNGGNIGVQFEIYLAFRGKTVKPAIVMADGSLLNSGGYVYQWRRLAAYWRMEKIYQTNFFCNIFSEC